MMIHVRFSTRHNDDAPDIVFVDTGSTLCGAAKISARAMNGVLKISSESAALEIEAAVVADVLAQCAGAGFKDVTADNVILWGGCKSGTP